MELTRVYEIDIIKRQRFAPGRAREIDDLEYFREASDACLRLSSCAEGKIDGIRQAL